MNPQPTILFLDAEEADHASVLSRYPQALFGDYTLQGDALVEAAKDADVISTFITTNFTADVLKRLPKLKLLCTRSVGYDHIDLPTCKQQGIVVTHVPDYGSHVIAEHAFALLLGTLRHISEGNRRVESGSFDYRGLRGLALMGKTIGIVGTGRIGRKVAQIAHGFEMHILATDVYKNQEVVDRYGVKYVELPELLANSDIVTLHVPASKDTAHLLDADAISKLKDGAIVVNTARGALVDSKALLAALQSGKVAWALLDVLEFENNIELSKDLIAHPRTIITPHIAFYADDSLRNMYQDCFTSIDQWMKGEAPAHAVALPA